MLRDCALQEPFAVNGSVIITLNMTRPSPCIVLHARGMTIKHLAIEEPHTHGELSHHLSQGLKGDVSLNITRHLLNAQASKLTY